MEALLEKLSLFLRHTQLETPQLRWVFIPTQGQHTALDIRVVNATTILNAGWSSRSLSSIR